MRWHGSWMEDIDERLLKTLNGADDPLTAWQLSFDLGNPTRQRLRERCRVLGNAGFVVVPRPPLNEQYEITSWGEGYLHGEVDADLRRPLPAPKPPEKMRPSEYAGFGNAGL